jgi:indole-3-glycerol phosphate synthase
MRRRRRFSQAISEGESISVLAAVGDAGAAHSAEADGAEGVVVRAPVPGLRDATELPILWCAAERDSVAAEQAGADAWLLAVAGHEDEDGDLERLHAEAFERGLDCVVAVRDEDELRLALDRIDPEIFLLASRESGDGRALEHVLSLLPDLPAGKLAIADLEPLERSDLDELGRAGVDAVVVHSTEVARLAQPPPPEV